MEPTAPGTPATHSANVPATIAYLFGWISGLFFFLTSKDAYVRFHAAQSIIISVAFTVIYYVLMIILPYSLYLVINLVALAMLVLVIILMVKAYKGERFKLPVVGDYAEKMIASHAATTAPPAAPTQTPPMTPPATPPQVPPAV